MTITGPQPAGPEFAADFAAGYAEASAVAAEAAAGTPLAALATEAAEDGQAARLETLDGRIVLTDGREWTVRILNRDFVAWDLTRPKKKWPAAEDAPFLLNNFLAWTASRRAGHDVGTFEAFIDAADLVKLTQGEAARPTR